MKDSLVRMLKANSNTSYVHKFIVATKTLIGLHQIEKSCSSPLAKEQASHIL